MQIISPEVKLTEIQILPEFINCFILTTTNNIHILFTISNKKDNFDLSKIIILSQSMYIQGRIMNINDSSSFSSLYRNDDISVYTVPDFVV